MKKIPNDGSLVSTKINEDSDISRFPFPYVKARKNAKGWFKGLAPNGKGNLWWVEHFDKTISLYYNNEVRTN